MSLSTKHDVHFVFQGRNPEVTRENEKSAFLFPQNFKSDESCFHVEGDVSMDLRPQRASFERRTDVQLSCSFSSLRLHRLHRPAALLR